MGDSKILFAPGLYKDEGELDFYAVQYVSDSDELPSLEEYKMYFADKLGKILVSNFANRIYGNYDVDDLTMNLAYAEVGGGELIDLSEEVSEWKNDLKSLLTNSWDIDEFQLSYFNLDYMPQLAEELVGTDILHYIITSFYDRISAIKEGKGLIQYYIGEEVYSDEKEYLESTIQELPNDFTFNEIDFGEFDMKVREARF